MRRLREKTCLIFGGGSEGGEINNGLAAAVTYAREAANVVIVDVSEAAVQGALQRVRSECAELGRDCALLGIVGDVTSEAAVREAVDQTIARFGRIDVLHNNVGVVRAGGPMELSIDEWNSVLSVNLTSMFLTCKYVLPHMLKQGAGSIINIGSVGGLRYVGYNYPSYSASKGAVIQFTQSLALQYAAKGIRANTIAPGYIKTPLIYRQVSGAQGSPAELIAARDALSPTGHMGSPFDVANAALFLASDEASYINGICLPVDGGLSQSTSLADM